MKYLLLSLVAIIMGCGGGDLLRTNTADIPNFVWQPFAGVVIESSEHEGLYKVTVKCQAYLDFSDFAISELEEECSVNDFVDEAHFLVSRDQLNALAVQKKRYWDYYLNRR